MSVEKKHSPRRIPDRRIDPIVFGVASLIAAAVLVALVAIPQYLSKQRGSTCCAAMSARSDGSRPASSTAI
ncbi:MAG: hypothetical protein R3D01_03770 [Hyphomicrobiales bacterium]